MAKKKKVKKTKTSVKKEAKPKEKKVKRGVKKPLKKKVSPVKKSKKTTRKKRVTGKGKKPKKTTLSQDVIIEKVKEEKKPVVTEEKIIEVKEKETPPPKKSVELQQKPPIIEEKKITIDAFTTVAQFAEKMGVKVNVLIKKLLEQGVLATINQRINPEIATLIGHDFGFSVEIKTLYGEEELVTEEKGPLIPRPPVVTMMGHVDHGKTSLLDVIRKSHIVSKEFGGITQHIGAYCIEDKKGKIVFLDTPGHEAFTAMRARGASVTDIVVLVVAADDGVMPQTVEAINHAKAANVPIIVAINKIDLSTANPEKVKQQLTNYELVPEQWGGKTIYVEVSALEKKGIDELLEMILLEAEMLELKANPNTRAKGFVIEAKLDKQKGPLITVLIQNGTLSLGDAFVAGYVGGKVKALINEHGEKITKGMPGLPVEILGANNLPEAGDRFIVVENERKAREISEIRMQQKHTEFLQSQQQRISLRTLKEIQQTEKIKQLNIILKADVRGSIEAISDALERMNTENVHLNIVHKGVGGITDSDVLLAAASNGIIIGFNVKPQTSAENRAKTEKVEIRIYRVIYEIINDIRNALEGLLPVETKENILGKLEVLKTFRIYKVGTVAGAVVKEGKILKDAKIRVVRDNIIIHEGRINSLKRFKDDVSEVKEGFECGVSIANFNDIKVKDILEVFEVEKIQKKLEFQ